MKSMPTREDLPSLIRLLALLVVATLLAGLAPALAQDGRVSIVPRAGVHSVEDSRVDLTRVGPDLGLVRAGGAGFEENAIVGIGVDVDLPPRWLDLRLALDRTVSAEVISAEAPFRTGASLTTLGTDVLFRPLPSAGRVRPLLAVGWGMNRFAMDGRVPDAVVLEGSRIEGSLRLGVGVDLDVGPSVLRLEVMDSIGLLGVGGSRLVLQSVEGVQASLGGGVPNDFLITAGAVIPVH